MIFKWFLDVAEIVENYINMIRVCTAVLIIRQGVNLMPPPYYTTAFIVAGIILYHP